MRRQTNEPRDIRPKRPRAKWRTDVLAASGVIAVVAGAVVGFAYSRPATVAVTSAPSYTQSAHLSYSAKVSPDSVYGANEVTTGQPMYSSAVNAFTLKYSYRFETAAPASVSGTEQLVATVNNGEGLVRTLDLQPETTFSGDHFQAVVTVNLSTLTGIAKAFDQVGVGVGTGTYTLMITPSVVLHGHVDAVPVATSLDKSMNLNLSEDGVFSSSTSATASPGAQISSNPFSVASSGTVAVAPKFSNAVVFRVPVLMLRKIALIVLLASLLVAGLAALALLRERNAEDEATRFAARYASMLVEVRSLPSSLEVVIVPLSSFDDLVEVSQRLEVPILHEAGVTDSYGVIDGGVLYTYMPVPREAVAPLEKVVQMSSPGAEHNA
jgi:hypothetical protein